MLNFILNNEDISTDQPAGSTVLDFVRYHKDLKGTKIGCREGDCGACALLVGELVNEKVRYRTMTSCLMPLANAAGKHIVTIEGINRQNGSLTPVQRAMVDESGTQCGFCTVGFVMSLTGFCIDRVDSRGVGSPHVSKGQQSDLQAAISAIDGNICRCTGYKSIERAACRLSEPPAVADGLTSAIDNKIIPEYFSNIVQRLTSLKVAVTNAETRAAGSVPSAAVVSGGTDLYVQRPEQMTEAQASHLFYDAHLRGIRDLGDHIEIGASATVTDLLESSLMNAIFPELYKHLKLVSSTPIRNMATLAGNFVNASPIGDMTVWFLALDAEIDLVGVQAGSLHSPHGGKKRLLSLKDFYLGYKQLAKQPDEIITAIRFKKPTGDFRFNFEKVCKRTYLDIATVNTAISLTVRSTPGEGWLPPALSEPRAIATGPVNSTIIDVHIAAGGVAPIPLYLKETSEFLRGKEVSEETVTAANEIIQSEISPISDVRGTEQYKRLLLRQLFRAHFLELFATENKETTE